MTPIRSRIAVGIVLPALISLSTVNGAPPASATDHPNPSSPVAWVAASTVPGAERDAAVALSAPGAIKAPQSPSVVRVDRKSATSLKVWWSKVAGAKSYKVYRQVKGKWKVVKVTASLSWVNKKLPKRKVQRYRVAACTGVKGKGVCGGLSQQVFATTFGPKDKKVNVRAVKLVEFPRDRLGLHDKWDFGVVLTPTLWGELKRQIPVSVSLRMVSSNPSVVAVESIGAIPEDGVGRLVAKRAGSAVITVTAHNGVSTSVRLHVRDRACPVTLDDPIEGWIPSTYFASLIKAHGDKICELTSYVMTHSAGSGEVTLDTNGQLAKDGNLRLPDYLWGSLREVLSTGSVYPAAMMLSSERTSVYLYLNDIPWGKSGSRRAALEYRPYNYDQYGRLPTTHWSAWVETSGVVNTVSNAGGRAVADSIEPGGQSPHGSGAVGPLAGLLADHD